MKDELAWFDAKYKDKPTKRWATMRAAMNLTLPAPTIVETGCQREPEDWGAGMSTSVFGEFAKRAGGKLYTVDNNADHLARCKVHTAKWASHTVYQLDDSVRYLQNSAPKLIDLLYLDSFDYPYGTLLEIYGGKTDIKAAQAMLELMTEDAIVRKHGYVISDCQEHCLAEIKAAMPHLGPESVVLIDDAGLPGGGKARLANEYLQVRGWTLVLQDYQALWVQR